MAYQTQPLWDGEAPGALGNRAEDRPSLTIVEPRTAPNGAAVLVFPGGGFFALMDYEGEAYAEWLAGAGYTCFVVNYRLVPAGYGLPTIYLDAKRAVRWARANAAAFGFAADKLAVIGSSAGGHLCAALSVHWDEGDRAHADVVERVSSRPDAAILCYPAIFLRRVKFLSRLFAGKTPSSEELNYYCAQRWVRHDTPPAFLFHTSADEMVPPEHSLVYARALGQKKIPFELHIYERGQHGVALGNGHPWTHECLRWLQERFHS